MTDLNSPYSWEDEASLHVWPPDHPGSMFRGSLADCVSRAIELADSEPKPSRVEISHRSPRLIGIEEIRRMAADPSFPVAMPDHITADDFELGPMS